MLGQVAARLDPAVGAQRAPLLAPALWAGAGLVTAVLSLTAIGLPATLVLGGAWSLAFGYGRLHPALRGPAAWAAGIVTELAVLCSLDFALALVSAREHGRVVHLVILLVPPALGLAVAFLAPRLLGREVGTPADPAPHPSRAGLALLVTVVGLAIELWVSGHGRGYDVAWALSGDGRNHVLILRRLLGQGGITLSELRNFPALANDVAAIISGAGGRSRPPGALMLHDARAVSSTYVLAGIGLGCMFVAAILESLPRTTRMARRLPPGVLVVTLVATVTTASSFVLGTALLDGFFPTYATLPVAVAALVLAIRCLNDPSPYSFGLLGVATVFVLFAWTILAVVPVAATVVVTAALARRLIRGPGWIVASVVSLGAVLLVLGVLITQYGKLRTQFLVPGPPPTPAQHWVLYLFALIAVALLAGSPDREALWRRAVPTAVVAISLITVYWLRAITPDGQTWTYYGAKSLWALTCCVLWIAFLPIALAAAGAPARRPVRASADAMQFLAAGLAVILVVGLLTKVKDPLHEASHGWTQPSAGVVTEVATLGDQRKPFVLWGFSDPGDDRLGDFIAELTWGSTEDGDALPLPGFPQGFYEWGYEDDFTFPRLCLLARAVPELHIITKQPALRDQMRDSCPASGAHVLVTTAG